MELTQHIATLDALEGAMPLQWCFKDRLANGTYAELILRRVKAGHEAVCVDTLESGFATHLKGKFSNAATFDDRLHDAAITDEQALWISRAALPLLRQMAQLAKQQPALLQLFAPKGKLEIYGPGMLHCQPQYIAGNHTLKLHARDVNDSAWQHGLAHLLAQHLDFPVGPGERRFSTSRLFDLCFNAEKALVPNGLADAIDAQLLGRGIYHPDRHNRTEAEQVTRLLKGEAAAAISSYARVLQRERFATMVAWWACPEASRRFPSPILSHYHQLLKLDLAVHTAQHFHDYPPKKRDEVAEAIHKPLMLIFNPAGTHDKQHRKRVG